MPPAVIYLVAASVLAEKNPDAGSGEIGPASVKSKEEIVKYLKDSFAYAHKAMTSLTDKNLTEMVTSAFGTNKVPRVSMATVAVWLAVATMRVHPRIEPRTAVWS